MQHDSNVQWNGKDSKVPVVNFQVPSQHFFGDNKNDKIFWSEYLLPSQDAKQEDSSPLYQAQFQKKKCKHADIMYLVQIG